MGATCHPSGAGKIARSQEEQRVSGGGEWYVVRLQGVRCRAVTPQARCNSRAAHPWHRADAAGHDRFLPSTKMARATKAAADLSRPPLRDLPPSGRDTRAQNHAGSPSERSVSVFLVDSRTVVREGLCALINGQPGLAVLGQAAGIGSLERVDPPPDVIVTDVELVDARGPEVIRLLRTDRPSSAILVLTLVEQAARIEAVLAAGADGYVLKTASSGELIAGIRAVAQGETYLQPSLGVALSRWRCPADPDVRLTPAEERILGLLALGHTNGEMARVTNVSVRTVETHRARIAQKLGRRTRAELVRYAWASGLVDAGLC